MSNKDKVFLHKNHTFRFINMGIVVHLLTNGLSNSCTQKLNLFT